MNQFRNHAAHGLDAERERRHIEQQLDPRPSPDRMPACTAAPSATTSSGFSSVCGFARNSALDRRAHQRNARRPAHHHHFVDLLDA